MLEETTRCGSDTLISGEALARAHSVQHPSSDLAYGGCAAALGHLLPQGEKGDCTMIAADERPHMR